VVVVSHATRDHLSHLLLTLFRVLPEHAVARLVVVDNASTDGSRERLAALADAGLLTLIANRRQRHHGPALNQALSWLARHAPETEAVLVLDSDVLVLRAEAVRNALAALRASGAGLLGQEERLREHDADLVPLNALLLDPRQVWRAPIEPFHDEGDPSAGLQRSALAAGVGIAFFPLRHHSYLLHLGRGTLARVGRGHREHAWAQAHPGHHYGGHPRGPELHAWIAGRYAEEVPGDTTGALIEALRRPERISVPGNEPLPG
jgi:Glycosyl transferase family 2